MNIPTAHSGESLERFLNHILNNPEPEFVTKEYLENSGFGTGNDPELRHIFRLLGFLDSNFRPTERWDSYRKAPKETIRDAIDECYRDLLTMYPDAYTKSELELYTWFRPPITGNSRSSMERAVRTFKKLYMLAGYVADNHIKPSTTQGNESKPSLSSQSAPITGTHHQLVFQLPLSKDRIDYERIFEAFKKVFY